MNVELLQKVKAHILEEPLRINMGDWGTKKPEFKHNCKTVGCIAGWAAILSDKGFEFGQPLISGAQFLQAGEKDFVELLGLTDEQGGRLFYDDQWPEPFVDDIAKYHSRTPQYAKVVADRIDFFIKTNGTDKE